MSEFTVHVDDPSYPAGQNLVVAGIRCMFVNGEDATVDDSMVDPELVPDLEQTLANVAGFTVSPVGGSTPVSPDDQQATPPQDSLAFDPNVNANAEGGE